MNVLNLLWKRILKNIVAPTRPSSHQLVRLLTPVGRSASVRHQVALVIAARVQFVSLIFAILVPLFGVIDLIVFDWKTGALFTVLRLAAAVVFAVLALYGNGSLHLSYVKSVIRLLVMLLVPTIFYIVAFHITRGAVLNETQARIMELYGLLPTLVLAGLAIFPLSAIEILIYSLPVLGIAAWGMIETGEGLALALNGPTYWFMAMTMGVAMISGMSQSHYMESLVHHATTDPLTGILTRRAGMEALEHHMMDSIAQGRPLAVFFLDLDHFKQINDSFGHDAGDQALVSFVHALRNIFRRDDILIRWGGEEFIILIPGMAITAVPALLNKMRTHGVGRRVDGQPLQVSIGVAERQYDGASDWAVLVSLADQRMYRAKQQGRARAVLPDGGVVQIAMRN